MTRSERNYVYSALVHGVLKPAAGRCTPQLGLALLECRRNRAGAFYLLGLTRINLEDVLAEPVCRPHLALLHELHAEQCL